jgi:uncharacterized protein (UPF0548 family)
MFFLVKPLDRELRHFISQLSKSSYSYFDIGATASIIPHSYTVDHNRIRLGSGAAIWSRAVEAIKSWEMFSTGWTQLCWPDTPVREGADVAILIRHFGFYSLNGARIVYLVDDDGPVKRFGFAYGTLVGHADSGEERFMVEWNQQDDSVWYDLLAFSRPSHLLSRLGFPLARSLQRRFAADSKARMAAAVGGGCAEWR